MGRLLKEALKCLCSENHWSYAVFWKIGYRNPALLVWEEYHYEPARRLALPPISGIESTDMLLKEWEGIWSSSESCLPKLERQTDDRVVLLIDKMMINNQIHIVGEGIVGRAAFMGLHQWVLQETCMMEHYPSEVLAELHHQFSAGMETVAVIPVLPHGVVQFGSTSAVVESMGFVNDVKSLFAQLGGVPGALLSDTYTRTGPGPNCSVSTSRGSPISATSQNFSQSQAPMLAPFLAAGFNQQNLVIQDSEFGSQPFPSLVTQVQDNPQVQSNPNMTPTIFKSLSGLVQIPPVMQMNHLSRGLLESREIGAHVILPSTDTTFRQQASSKRSSLRSNNQFSESNSSCSSVTNAGVHILSNAGLQKPVANGLDTSRSNKPCITSDGSKISTSVKDSILARLRGSSKSFDAGNDLQTLAPVPSISVASGSIERSSGSQPLKGIHPNLPPRGMLSTSNHQNWPNNSDVLCGAPHQSQPSTDDNRCRTSWTGGEQVLENELFQSLHILSEHSDEHISRCRPMPDSFHGSWASNSLHNKEKSTSSNINYEEAYVQPPLGDDLFDILGLDLKSENHSVGWNSSLIHVADSNMRNADMDISTCIKQMDGSPGFYVAKEGISESGIFSETDSDHLLDAVVSKVQSSAKTIMDEEMSCWTTLTKISSSSVATGSPSCGQGSASEHKQGKSFDIPPPPIKAQVGSSSLKSGCTKDNTGETSQISSMYGSQISLVAEDSQNMKHENSISTAHSKRPHETGKTNRKRLKPGENPRPRPKDRQMIQDRVKELREIVPNGSKCSIDSLLERTIRHMLFLQSVTKHADKLKQTGESKIISKEGGLLLNDSFDGGATWAYEVGSQSMVCPIIVEDLDSPRQMLVEMLCEERGLFLEIADIIRGLGLTILKGVIEARNDKVWVRFTVEANRDVTRMEIFMALVHLLEQAVKNSTSASKGIASGNLLAHGTSHQASIPATGQSDNLQ